VVQLAVVVGLMSPPLLMRLWPALLSSGVVVVGFALVAAHAARAVSTEETTGDGRAFEPRQALLFVVILATVMVTSAALQAWLGDVALDAVLAVSGFADVHAAAASAAQLVAAGRVNLDAVLPGLALGLAANSATKMTLAWASGGRAYALRLLPGIACMLLAFVLTLWLW
jgi:uncharacterized membrane protein (DUF4010 family)